MLFVYADGIRVHELMERKLRGFKLNGKFVDFALECTKYFIYLIIQLRI